MQNKGYIQLRTDKYSNTGVHLVQDKRIVHEDSCVKLSPSTNTYLDTNRARQLAFQLLTAAKKLDRTKELV